MRGRGVMAMGLLLGAGCVLGLGGCAGSDAGAKLVSVLSSPASQPTGSTAGGEAGSAGGDTTRSASKVIALASSPTVTGSPTAVYERVARGALTCWFGGLGPLRKTHIFNADAAPPSQGGGAEITIHERELNPLPNQTPRGTRVFRLWFEREGDASTRVRMEAAKLPQDLAEAMEKDAVAWAAEKEQCQAQVVRPPPPPEEPPKAPKKRKAQPKRA